LAASWKIGSEGDGPETGMMDADSRSDPALRQCGPACSDRAFKAGGGADVGPAAPQAPRLMAAGASPRTVMKTLGHSQIGLTMNTYTHVLPEIEREAIDAAAKAIFG
jgi:hypothetical protein